MHLLHASGIEKAFGDRAVLRGCDLSVSPADRVGLVGVNGSGKSNILDSICFVLGITNLSQVRCIVVVYHVKRRRLLFCRVGGVLFYRRSTLDEGLYYCRI